MNKIEEKQAFVQITASYHGKIQQIHSSDIFLLKIQIPDEKSLFATLAFIRYGHVFIHVIMTFKGSKITFGNIGPYCSPSFVYGSWQK